MYYEPKGHPIQVGHVTVIAFSADGKTLAYGNADRTICLLDVDREQIRCTLHGHSGWIKSIAMSHNGKLLASGSTDQTIRLWDVQSGQLYRIIEGHAGWVNALTFSPDDQILASGYADETICLWDVHSGKHKCTFRGHAGWVNDLVFGPDGVLLISAGADQTVRLWDVQSGQLLQTLEGHSGWVWKVAVTDDGQVLASGSHDRTVRLWDISTVRKPRVTEGKQRGQAPSHTTGPHPLGHRHRRQLTRANFGEQQRASNDPAVAYRFGGMHTDTQDPRPLRRHEHHRRDRHQCSAAGDTQGIGRRRDGELHQRPNSALRILTARHPARHDPRDLRQDRSPLIACQPLPSRDPWTWDHPGHRERWAGCSVGRQPAVHTPWL